MDGSVNAVVFRGPGRHEVESLTLGELGPYDLLVAIAGAGICHTDLAIESSVRSDAPAVLGHEGAGVVRAVGGAVTTLEPGDHVILSYDRCGRCGQCRSGRPYACERFREHNYALGSARATGGLSDSTGQPVYSSWFGQSSFADHAVVTERNAVRVDHDLPLELLGPLGCGLLTGAGAVVNALQLRPGQSIAISGVGAVGLAAVMAAVICGASRIVVRDVDPARLAVAESLGATETALAGSDPLPAASVDLALDTSGNPSAISGAVASLRSGGVCGLVAVGRPIELDPRVVVFGRTITGIVEGNADPHTFVPQLIEWWRAGRFPFDTLIRPFDLHDCDAALAAARDGSVIKPVLIPKHDEPLDG